MSLAPVVLFVYNRPRHTELTLNALAVNDLADQSVLFIYADGPKHDASPEALEKIRKTREIIRGKKWCKEVYIIESETNRGLADSIINGVSKVVNEYGKVIVLEDDLITSKYFLRFMNDALDTYFDEQKVISIGALNFFATDDQVPDTFFVPIPDCWGWATWKDRWQLFEPNPQKLLSKLRDTGLLNKFNLYGAYNFEKMLIDQVKGNISSWAIRWQAVAYLENKLALYPKYSVTKNIGFDAEGTHSGKDSYSKKLKFADKKINVEKADVKEDPEIIKRMMNGYLEINKPKASGIKLTLKKYLKYITPPVLRLIYRKVNQPGNNSILWAGNYTTWSDAKKDCSGYEAPSILEKTREAIVKVKNGEAAGERDSVILDQAHHNWQIIAFLLKIAIENDNQLDIIDFGGSLGSSYFQNRDMIPPTVKLSWNIIEQERYIDIGNRDIADDRLHFFYSIDEACRHPQNEVLLLSSVLQYLEKPYDLLDKVMKYEFEYIIIDRTAFIDEQEDRLTVQYVPDHIYKASYPAWFFNNSAFKNYFSERYTILLEFDSDLIGRINLDAKTNAYWRGYVLKRKTT